jgi:hypothetical protein
LKKSLADQIGGLAIISAEQGLVIADLREQVKDRDNIIAGLKAALAERAAMIRELESQLAEPELPMGDARPGHEGEANGIAH